MHKLVKIAVCTGLVFMQQSAYPMQALQKLVQKSTQSAQGFFNKAAQTWLKDQGALGAQKAAQVLGKQPKTAMLPTTLNNLSLFANFGKTLAHNQSALGLQAVRAMNYQHNKKQLPLGLQTTAHSQLSNNKIMPASAGLWATMYVKGLRWWFGDDINLYCSLTTEQKDVMLSDMVQELKQGKDIQVLPSIYSHSSKEQKDIVISAIVQAFKEGKEVCHLGWIYEESTDEQKDVLLQILKQDREIEDLLWIYHHSNEEQRNIILSNIIKMLKNEKKIKHFPVIYALSNEKQKSLLFPFLAQNFNFRIIPNTQSGNHLQENISEFTESFEHLNTTLEVFNKAMEYEAELIQKKHYVFYHAQMWNIYWLELLYTKLWQLKHTKQLDNYIFTRFPENSDCNQSAQHIAQEKELRRKILREGRFDKNSRQALLFTNYALFANTTNLGSSTPQYFLNNSNISKLNIQSKEIFEKFKQGSFYLKHKKEIDSLEEEFNNLSIYGNLIQISVPKNHLEKHIYLAKSGGYKAKAQLKREGPLSYLFETRNSDNVLELLETLKSNPEKIINSDEKEFAWIVTEDTVQKAIGDGVQIQSFNTANPESFARVMHKLDTLLEKLVQEDVVVTQPKFGSEKTPWECYQEYKASSKILDKNKL
ncbi:MAG: hypothetical protein AB7R69_00395 [Candidatus Babeliales bacterium]